MALSPKHTTEWSDLTAQADDDVQRSRRSDVQVVEHQQDGPVLEPSPLDERDAGPDLAQAVARGAAAGGEVAVRILAAPDAGPADVLAAAPSACY